MSISTGLTSELFSDQIIKLSSSCSMMILFIEENAYREA